MKIESKQFDRAKFKLIEDHKTIDFEIIRSMIVGDNLETPVYIVRSYYNPEVCKNLKDEFCQIIDETNGGNRAKDFVSVEQIGATQFMKTTQEYFDECKNTKSAIDRMIQSIPESIQDDLMLEKGFKDFFEKQNKEWRPSSYQGDSVNLFTARRWTNESKNLTLLPHEDFSQLQVAKKEGYEIGEVQRVIACNLCISNNFGGELIFWNFEPDYATKKELNVELCGYPYPVELMSRFDHLKVDVKEGDLYFINANFVHGIQEMEGNDRITMGRFIGLKSDNEVVYWT